MSFFISRSFLRVSLLVLVLLLVSCCEFTRAHESCCKFKLHQHDEHHQQEPAWIDDPTDTTAPPAIWEDQPRYMDDPNDTKPEDWDDEDDGDWAPVTILNPAYTWKPRQIPNPEYVPPPTYWDKLQVEILAAVPWVTVGVLITGMLSLISLPMDTMHWWLIQASSSTSSSAENNKRGYNIIFGRILPLLSAALLGLATPLCSCGALPLCAALLKQGVPFSSALAFLTASQSSGLDSAAVTYGLLGARAMLGRLGGAIALAVAVGLVCPSDDNTNISKQVATNEQKAKVPPVNSKKATSHDTSPLPSSSSSLPIFSRVLSTCLETATEIYPTVLMGLILSTAALHFSPSLTSYVSSSDDDLWMRVMLLVSAVPLQFCEHTSVTLASAIQKAGGSPGLAFAFLLSAPATNLPTILWMWNYFGRRGHGVLLPLTILMVLCGTALFLSYIVDISQLDLLAGESTGEMAQLPGWLADSSPYLAASLWLAGVYQKYCYYSAASSSASTSSKATTSKDSNHCGACCDDPLLVEKTKAE